MEQDQRVYPLSYPPIPKVFIKEEPKESNDEEDRDEQEHNLLAYSPLLHGYVKKEPQLDNGSPISNSGIQMENTEQDVMSGQENDEPQEYQAAYSSFSKGIVKEELPVTSDEDDDACQLVAYPPLPHGIVKEETECGDESIPGVQQQLATEQEETLEQRNQNNETEETTSLFDDEPPVADMMDYTKPQRAAKRKRTTKGIASKDDRTITGSEEAMSSSRALRSHSKGKSIRKVAGTDGSKSGNSLEVGNSGGEDRRQNSEYDDEDIESPDDEDLVQCQSKAGPSQRKKKEAVRSSAKTTHPKETGLVTERPAIECRKCRQSFKRQKSLNRHLKEVCGVDERKFHCKECGLKFKQKMCLRRHLMNIHKVDRTQLAAYGIVPKLRPTHPFQCDKCARSYKRKQSLVQHLKYECGVQPGFPCTLCNYRPSLKSDLRKHLTLVHDVDRSQLDNYGNAAKEIRPVLPFKCDKCERTYTTKCNLQQHLSYECGLDPTFTCTQCDYRAKLKSNLSRHLRNVHGEGPACIK